MANSEYIGTIVCPLCGNEHATVHEQRTGTKRGRRYYRCYSEINGSQMECGTIQCIGPAGQAFIKANMKPIGQEAAPVEPKGPIGQESPPAPKPPEPTPQPPEQPPKPEKDQESGLLSGLVNFFSDEEVA